MSAKEQICFDSAEAKLRDFPGRVIPAMRKAVANAQRGVEGTVLDAWIAENIRPAYQGEPYLRALHGAAQVGRYRKNAPIECDTVYVEAPVSTVLADGGDCDQWSVIIAAALKRAGYKPVLFGFGDSRDPWLHVAVGVRHGGAWYLLDAKGSARGLPFNVWPDKPVEEARL